MPADGYLTEERICAGGRMSSRREPDLVALEIAKRFAARLRSVVPDCEVRLFGSCARGEAQPDSDIDVFVEVRRPSLPAETRQKIEDVEWEVGFEAGRVLQAFVYLSDEIWKTPRRSSPFVQAVQREGMVI
ncbi:MAG: nucleotidyltransferase domain-containing protein [Planctomycetes bacterium]|nr:nucleotidyltransferase domain-containing protein [Planctomycetota bacterium]